MHDLFVPVIEGKENAHLHRVSFKLELDNKSDHWNTPPIITGSKFKPSFRNIENYFTVMYKDANSASVYFSHEENNKPSLNLTDSTMSVMLGIFLSAAASKITGWKVKDCWQSITATGTFEEPDFRQEYNGTLNLEAISEPDEKLKAFEKYANDEKNICYNGKKHLFIYISEDVSLIYESNTIQVKSFSPINNTLFDILDFIFELPVLPAMILEKKQEKYFNEFEEISDYVIKQNNNISEIYNNILNNDEYKNKHIYIHDQDNNGKSYAFQFARNMIWNRKIYAPIWIKIDSKPQTDDKNIIPIEIQDKLFLSLFTKEKKEKHVSSCLSIFNEKPFLLILDNIPDDINSLNDFISRMEIFCKNIEKKSKVIFIGKNNYDSKKSKFIKPFFIQHEDKKKIKDKPLKPVKSIKLSKPALPLFKLPLLDIKIKRKTLIRGGIIAGIILISSLIYYIATKDIVYMRFEAVGEVYTIPIPEGLEYEIIDDQYVIITGYTGEDTDLVIPAYIQGLPVTVIGREAFPSNLITRSIIIPETVTTIGFRAFYFYLTLENIYIPASVTIIEGRVFPANLIFSDINVDINNKYFKSINGVLFDKDVKVLIAYPAGKMDIEYNIPSSVIKIGNEAFLNCNNFTTVNIPSSVKFIGNSSFEYCTNLTYVNIPSSIIAIGKYAFAGCISLESIYIPSSVAYIGKYAFFRCNSLKNVIFLASINIIKEAVFARCTSLEEIIIPPTVKTIEKWAFNTSGLKNIIIPESINTIGFAAFGYSPDLISVSIPASVSNINDLAFINTGLSTVTISRNTILGNNVFDSRVRIQYYEQESRPVQVSSNIPETVVTPSNEYFIVRGEPVTLTRTTTLPLTVASNEEEQSAEIVRQQYTYENFLYEYTGINVRITGYIGNDKELSIPNIIGKNLVTSIGENAFRGNNNIEIVRIPFTVTSIGSFAFFNCINLKEVTIPAFVRSISGAAFMNCPNLTTVTISPSTILGKSVFDRGVEILYYD